MLAVQPKPITNDAIKKIKSHQEADYEAFSSWVPAGSGNFEKTRTDGRYRKNCNTYRDTITCENHKIIFLFSL